MNREKLLGSWSLVSWRISVDGREGMSEPFGAHPRGLLVYTDDGWMSAAISRDDRALLPRDVPLRRIDAPELAQAFTGYFHYAGPYRVTDDRVVHYVEHSLNPNFPGTEQLRQIEWQGDDLVLSGTEPLGALTRRHRLHWRRADAVAALEGFSPRA